MYLLSLWLNLFLSFHRKLLPVSNDDESKVLREQIETHKLNVIRLTLFKKDPKQYWGNCYPLQTASSPKPNGFLQVKDWARYVHINVTTNWVPKGGWHQPQRQKKKALLSCLLSFLTLFICIEQCRKHLGSKLLISAIHYHSHWLHHQCQIIKQNTVWIKTLTWW